MAKLRSLIKVEGTLDDLTFYKGKEGYLVRTKGGVSANRIKSDPAFARTRENGSEFGHCATSGKILRRAVINLIADAKDYHLFFEYAPELKNSEPIHGTFLLI